MYIQSRLSEMVISMCIQVKNLIGFLLICLLTLTAHSQPLPIEAFNFGEIKMPSHLQNESKLAYLCMGKDGRMYVSNSRHLFAKKGNQLEAIAGQGLGGIPTNLNKVFQDDEGKIWAESNQTMYLFNDQKNQFEQHLIIADGDTLRPGLLKVCAWGQELLMVSKDTLIYIYNPDTKQCKPLPLSGNIKNPLRVLGLSGQRALITCGPKLFLLDNKGRARQISTLPTGTEILNATLLYNNWLYAWSIESALYIINLSANQYERIAIGKPVWRPLGQIFANGKYYALLGGRDSLYFFEPKSNSRFSWHSSERQKGAKFFPRTNSPVQDISGRVWMPNGNSLVWFDVPKTAFSASFTHLNKLAGMPQDDFLEPKHIGVSSFKPIVLYTAGKTLYVYDSATKKIIQQAVLPVEKEFSFRSLLEISENEWLASASQGLFRYNLNTNRFTEITYLNESLRLATCIVLADSIIIKERNYKLYKCAVLSPEKLIPYTNTPEYIRDFSSGFQNEIYAINKNGLMVLQQPSETWSLLTPIEVFDNVFIGNLKIALHPLRKEIIIFGDGKIWIISPGDGKVIKHISANSPGFPYAVNQIIPLDYDHVLLAQYNQPLTILNLSTQIFYPIGLRQGWWGENMGAQTSITSGHHNDWWATVDAGLVHFTTNQLLEKPLSPPAPEIYEIQIQYLNHPLPASRYLNDPLEVSYQKGTVSFMFGGLEADSIEYCLPPFDNIWRRGLVATFTNLPGGLYNLKVREAGSAGRYSPETILMLRILPPFWKTIWFRVLASLFLAGFAYLLFRIRLKQQNEKHAQQLQLAQSELKAIRSQMNPHFIFNCMTAIDGLIATKQNQKASEYLGKFSKMVRQVLQLSEKQLISLRDELDTLKLYLQLEQLRMQDGFTFSINADSALLDNLEVPPLLLQPFVENAIIHGLKSSKRTDKQIAIEATQINQTIQFSICDNGLGRSLSHAQNQERHHHTSMGTKLTNERLLMMEKVLGLKTNIIFEDLKDHKGNALGTRVIIELHPDKKTL